MLEQRCPSLRLLHVVSYSSVRSHSRPFGTYLLTPRPLPFGSLMHSVMYSCTKDMGKNTIDLTRCLYAMLLRNPLLKSQGYPIRLGSLRASSETLRSSLPPLAWPRGNPMASSLISATGASRELQPCPHSLTSDLC